METIENSVEYTEITEVPLQHRTMAFWYKVFYNNDSFNYTVLASNTSDAAHVINTQFPLGSHHYIGCSEKIARVNGTEIVNV